MKTSKQILTCCASIQEGDGISPRHEKKYEQNRTFDNRRLCRQIQKTVRLAIAELGLSDWDAAEVCQVAGKAVLQVKMVPVYAVSRTQCQDVMAWLNHHQGAIRTRVAGSIHRKTVPSMHFLLGESGLGEREQGKEVAHD